MDKKILIMVGLVITPYFGAQAAFNRWTVPESRMPTISHATVNSSVTESPAGLRSERAFSFSPAVTNMSLHDCARNGDVSATVALLNLQGVNAISVDAVDAHGYTALHLAAKYGHAAIVLVLLRYHARTDILLPHNWYSPLSFAAINGHADMVRILLSHRANPNWPQHPDYTSPLHSAASSGRVDAARLLLDAGARVDVFYGAGFTPLLCAAKKGHPAVAQLLLERGADVYATTTDNRTVLHWALEGLAESWATQDYLDLIGVLLKYNADVSGSCGTEKLTVLHLAARTRRYAYPLARAFLQFGAALNAQDLRGRTPLDFAVLHNNAPLQAFLRSQGARLGFELRGA